MAEKTTITLQVDVLDKEAIKLAADKEFRSLSNFLLNTALERAREKYEIVPKKETEI
jgi:uncharacterized protein (DUF1778 family)